MATEVIKFKGQFDVSEIMSSIKQMRAELAKSGNSALLVNLDKEISKIEDLGSTIQAQIGKGFASGKEFKQFESNISKLELDIQKIGQSFNAINADNLKEALKGVDAKISSMKQKAEEMSTNFKNIFRTNSADIKGNIANNLKKEISAMVEQGKSFEEVQKRVSYIYDELIRKQRILIEGAAERKNNLLNQVNAVQDSGFTTENFKVKYQKGTINNEQLNQINQIYETAIRNSSSAKEALASFDNELSKLNIKILQAGHVHDQLRDGFNNFQESTKNNRKEISELDKEIAKQEKEENKLIETQKQFNAVLESSSDALNKAVLAQQQVATAEKNSVQEKEELVKKSKQEQDVIDGLNIKLEKEGENLHTSAIETGEAVEAQERMNSTLDDLKSKIAYVFSLGNAYQQVKNVIQSTYNDVTNIDSAFASIAMVTNKTISQLWESYSDYAQMAQRLGQSTESAIRASSLFYQQGLDTAEALTLTEDTMKLATLAGLDFEKATSQMTAALRGFHMEMDQGAHVTDVYSELAAHAAADVNGIAYAMSKTASIANSAGMSFENTAAFLTQMIETTQEAPENIGTAMKTIIARFTELKTNVAGTAESEFEDLDYNKVDKALKSVGISIKDATGQFRNLDEVFLELSQKWNTLDRNSQRYIATIAAGSRQQSRFIAMMENYDRTMELIQTTQNSLGRSQEQFEKNADSLKFKVQELKTAWEQFRMSLADNAMFKKVVDMLTNIVNTINKLDKKQLLAISLIGITIGKDIITNLVKSLSDGAKNINSAGQTLGKAFSKGWKIGVNAGQLKDTLSGLNGGRNNFTQQEVIDFGHYQELSARQEKINQEINVTTDPSKFEQLTKELNNIEGQIKTIKEDFKNKNITIDGDDKNPFEKVQSETAKELSRTLSAGVRAAATTGLMAAISGADLSTALESSLSMGLAAAAPGIINIGIKAASKKLSPVLESAGAAIAALPLEFKIAAVAITAIIGTIAYAASKRKKALEALEKAELDRYKNIEKANKELQQKQLNAISELNEVRDSSKNLDKNLERYQYLSSKTFLNSAEQEELNNLYEDFTTNYKEIINSSDENTKSIDFNTIAINNLKETYETQQKESQDELIRTTNNIVRNVKFQYDKTNKIIEEAKDLNLNELAIKDGKLKDVYYNPEQYEILEEQEKVLSHLSNLDLNMFSYMREGFSLSDLENINTFNNYLIKANLSFKDFINNLEKANNEQNSNDIVKEAIQNAVKTQYSILEIPGLELEGIILDMLAENNLNNGININIGEEFLPEELTKGKFALDPTKTALRAIKSGVLTNVGLSAEQENILKTFFTSKEFSIGDFFSSPTDLIATNLNSYEQLPEVFQEFLQSENYTDQWDTIRTDAEGSLTVLSEFFKSIIEENTILRDVSEEELTQYANELNQWKELQQEIESLTWAEYERKLNLIRSNVNDNLNKKIQDYSQETTEQSFKQNLDIFNQFGLKEFSYKLALGLQNAIIKIIEDANLSSEGSKALGQLITTTFEGINSNAQEILAGVDFKEGFTAIMSSSKDYINALIDTGYTLEQATELFNNYIYGSYRIMGKAGYGSTQAELFLDNLQEDVSNFDTINEKLIKAQEEYGKKGVISQKTYFELIKNGFEDYVTKTSNGYELLADKAGDYFTESAMAPLKTLKEQIKYSEELYQDYQEVFNSTTRFSFIGGPSSSALKAGEILRRAIGDNDAFSYNDLLKIAKEDSTTFQKLSDELGLTASQFNLINNAASEGTETIQQYLSGIKEYISTISDAKYQDDLYLDGLINITSTYASAREEVEKLQDSLDELKKTQEKNTESLQDAQKAYREAMHGTELFQSSLDGLINYNTHLTDTNNSIEDLKQNLEDVKNIEEGIDIFNNLSNNYTKKSANLSAQNVVINDALKNLRSILLSNYGNFISFEGDTALVDFAYLEMDANDELRKAFEKEYQTYESYIAKRRENEKEIKSINKERENTQKEALSKYADLQKDVIEILKNAAEEEIETTKEKYDALKEVDNDYLDALQESIDKQRELREKENSENALVTKEKKLSLMSRDTSGANAKDIQKLQQEVESDRQKLLDDSVDSIIKDLKELYETQQEAREKEIEYMEATTKNAEYFNKWAESIVSSWTSIEDMQDWFIQNNPEIDEMTVEQVEVYINGLEDKWGDLVAYQSLKSINFEEDLQAINTEMTALYTSTSENISKIGTDIQAVAEKAAEESQKTADRALRDAERAYKETEEKIKQTQTDLNNAEDNAAIKHKAVMKEMTDASQQAMEKTSVYAVKYLAEIRGIDLTDQQQATKFAQKYHYVNNGVYSETFKQAVKDAGGDESLYPSAKRTGYQIQVIDSNGPHTLNEIYDTKKIAEKEAKKASRNNYGANIIEVDLGAIYGALNKNSDKKFFKYGGLANYTGPAWVDGTPKRPEAFLNAEDTERIGHAAQLFAESPILNSSAASENAVSASIGDTTIEININVENIADDYDVDRLVERVHQDIVETAAPTGTPVILHKK